MKCIECGKIFVAGNRPDGIPNGIALALENGKRITFCCDCIMKIGAMTEKEKESFFAKYIDK